MKTRSIRRAWPIVPVAIACILAAGPMAAGASVGPFSLGFKAPVPPRPAFHRHRAHVKPSTTYTIDDLITIPSTTIQSSSAIAFNNTGQILGTGYYHNTWSCLIFDNGSIVAVRKAAMTYCQPGGISNSNSGSLHFTGWADISRSQNEIAFVGSEGSGSASVRLLERRQPGELQEVNNNGVAVGEAYYEPKGGFFMSRPPFAYSNNAFKPLQPQCVTNLAGCMEATIGDYNNSGSVCPFGGCAITDANLVLGLDDSTGQLMTYTVGNEGSAADTPISWGPAYPAGINNENVIAYAYYDPSGETYPAYEYQLGASSAVALGTLPGFSCEGYFPISENNTGAVLGFTYNCASQPETYFTWDPVNGMQDLGPEIPANSYTGLTPLGINDNGQILLNLTASDGTNHWGVLVPQASGSTKAHRAVRSLRSSIRTI